MVYLITFSYFHFYFFYNFPRFLYFLYISLIVLFFKNFKLWEKETLKLEEEKFGKVPTALDDLKREKIMIRRNKEQK